MRDILDKHFDKSELEDLCFDLEVDYDNLRGERKTDKARELLLLIYRQDRLPDLLEAVQTSRPTITLPDLPTLRQQAATWRKVSTRAERIRHTLIQNVRSVWVDGVLHHANDILLSLDLAYTPDALQRDVPLLVRDETVETAVDSSLVEVFQEHARRLLILGEPSSGKTFTLLQLTEALLEQAEHDLIHPIPVVLNLSSWALAQKPLPEWIAEEMLSQYQVARKVTTAWLEQDELLLMLDGLDEVAESHRNDCLLAINAFMAEYQAELVVCSRLGDYEQLKDRLNVSTAVRLQPLTDSEIARYLSQPGLELQAILDVDPDLHELARSPLMLTVMTLAYHGLSQAELTPLDSATERRQHLFGKYVEQVFRRRPLDALNNNVRWLTHLAKGMSQERLSVFYIERLQLTWLSSPKWYLALVGLIFGLTFGLAFGLTFGLAFGYSPSQLFFWGLCGGLSGSLGVFLGSFAKNKWIHITITVVSSMLIFVLISQFFLESFTGVFYFGMLVGLFIGLISRSPQIETIELLRLALPTRRNALIKFGQGILLGLIFVLSVQLIGMLGNILSGTLSSALSDTLSSTLIAASIAGLIFGLISLVTTFIQPLEIERKTQPNQGVHNSVKSAFLMLLFVALPLGVAGFLADVKVDSDSFFPSSIFLGMLSILYYGGAAFLKHYALRFLLAFQGILPFKLVPFLDTMAERIILRRVGGGYIFIHRYLLEYFASLDSDSA